MRVPPEDVHGNKFHALKAKGSLYKDRQDGQEPVGSDVVNQSSTGDGTWILPVLESPPRSVRPTTEGNNKAGDGEHNNQGDWWKLQVVSGIRTEALMKIPLFIKEKQNSDSPKYRTPIKLKETTTIKMAAM